MKGIESFLSSYPPFDELAPPLLRRAVAATQIEFFAEGDEILIRGEAPAKFLYVVRTGAVQLLTDGVAVDLLVEGEVFGHPSLTSGSSPAFTARAHEETLCYLVDGDVAMEILATRRGLTFMSDSLRRRTARALELRAELVDPHLTRVGDLIRRRPVVCRPDDTVRAAAKRMAEERVSSLLVIGDGPPSILTDRDFRSRVLALGHGPDVLVREVMSSPLITVGEDAVAQEALLVMLESGVHHLPVVDRLGDVTGVISDTDLMGLERTTPFFLLKSIHGAQTDAAVAEEGRGLGAIVVRLVEAEFDPVLVGRVVSAAFDAMTRRLIDLSIRDLGDPPGPWAWLALGSEARREQAIATDQDHALAFDVAEPDVVESDAYFESLARRVADGLEAAGFPRCPGGILAENPAWRRTRSHWAATFPRSTPGHAGRRREFGSVALDYRTVAGTLDIDATFDDAIRDAGRDAAFLRELAIVAVASKPPTGFFRDLVVEDGGEHAGTLDVKAGGIGAITALGRVYALRIGLTDNATLQRIGAAADAGEITAESAAELEESFRLLWRVRLEHQAKQIREGRPADDHVDPGEVGPLTRIALKEAFRAIARAQRVLSSQEGLRLR